MEAHKMHNFFNAMILIFEFCNQDMTNLFTHISLKSLKELLD